MHTFIYRNGIAERNNAVSRFLLPTKLFRHALALNKLQLKITEVLKRAAAFPVNLLEPRTFPSRYFRYVYGLITLSRCSYATVLLKLDEYARIVSCSAIILATDGESSVLPFSLA